MDFTPWQGRDEGPGAIHTRWHHMVYEGQRQTGQEAQSMAIVGFESDEGTVRNQGRPGAADGPHKIRHALAQLAFHGANVVHDRGNVRVDGHELEAAQQRAGRVFGEVISEHRITFVLGGGHETSYATYRGLRESGALDGVGTWGVISLDTHFGLRRHPVPTAVTAFRQVHRDESETGRDFRYSVIGVSEPDNTRAQFENAHKYETAYLKDADCCESRLAEVLRFVDEQLEPLELVHLSLDLDVLPGWVAPGVSAPATLGVPPIVVEEVCKRIAASGKVAVVDIVGMNPRFDTDDRTARIAARLLNWIAITSFDRPAADAPSSAAQDKLLSERERSLGATRLSAV